MLSHRDLSNADFGGYILVDDQGRIYVDVVLHNKAPASDDPIGDPLPILEQSATYFVCLSKNPANINRRKLTTISNPFDPETWIWFSGDIIHVVDVERPPPAPPALPPAAPSGEWLWMLPHDLCEAEHSEPHYDTHADALAGCLRYNCSGLANKSQLENAYYPAIHYQEVDRCPHFGWVDDEPNFVYMWANPNRTSISNGCAPGYTAFPAGTAPALVEKKNAYCVGCPIDVHQCSSPLIPPPVSPDHPAPPPSPPPPSPPTPSPPPFPPASPSAPPSELAPRAPPEPPTQPPAAPEPSAPEPSASPRASPPSSPSSPLVPLAFILAAVIASASACFVLFMSRPIVAAAGCEDPPRNVRQNSQKYQEWRERCEDEAKILGQRITIRQQPIVSGRSEKQFLLHVA